jgi:hypothetical protein
MTRILLLVGSPRGRRSTSSSISTFLSSRLNDEGQEIETLWISEQLVTEERTKDMMEAIQNCDTLVLTAPLYDDCQPYIVTKTMELMGERGNLDGKRLIPIINSGFPQADQITAVAIPIYKLFASKTGLNWMGSLAIGGGEGLQGATGKSLEEAGGAAKNIIEELGKISKAIIANATYHDNEVITFPKFLLNPALGPVMAWINNRSWKAMAKKNGEKVDAKPYA